MIELIKSFKIIKLYSWQQFFSDKIEKTRQVELSWIKKNFLVMLIIRGEFALASSLVIFNNLLY